MAGLSIHHYALIHAPGNEGDGEKSERVDNNGARLRGGKGSDYSSAGHTSSS